MVTPSAAGDRVGDLLTERGQRGGEGDRQDAGEARDDCGDVAQELAPLEAGAAGTPTELAHPAESTVPARITANQSPMLAIEIQYSRPQSLGESGWPALSDSSVRLSKKSVAEQGREQRHLEPEDGGAAEVLEVGREEEKTAAQREHQPQDHGLVHRSNAPEMADLPGETGRAHRDERVAVGRHREAAAEEDAGQVCEQKRGLEPRVVRVVRGPRFDQAGEAAGSPQRGEHGSLQVWLGNCLRRIYVPRQTSTRGPGPTRSRDAASPPPIRPAGRPTVAGRRAGGGRPPPGAAASRR